MSRLDQLHRFIFENMSVRGELIHLDQSYQTIINQHQYPESIKKTLGEALCVAAMLSAILKFKGRLSVQFRGEGKLKLLLAQCNNHFKMRALAKWDGVDLTQEDLITAFENGVLVITLDSGNSSQRYQGIVAWRGHSIAESIEGYFIESEQLATKIWLTVNDESAAGLLLQVIPHENKKDDFVKSVTQSEWDHVNQMTKPLTPDMLLNSEAETLLQTLYGNDEIRLFPAEPLEFKCNCSRKKGENAIRVIGKEEAEIELKEKQSIVVNCDFCNKEYVFDRVDVAAIFEDQGPPPETTLH